MKQTANELADWLEDTLIELKDTVDEIRIQMRNAPDLTQARAKGYWLAQLIMALDNDHSYLGSGFITMQDTINELREEEPDED